MLIYLNETSPQEEDQEEVRRSFYVHEIHIILCKTEGDATMHSLEHHLHLWYTIFCRVHHIFYVFPLQILVDFYFLTPAGIVHRKHSSGPNRD